MSPFLLFYTFFVQNMATSYGVAMAPLLARGEDCHPGFRRILVLSLAFFCGMTLMFLLDWVLCRLAGLDWLRVWLIFSLLPVLLLLVRQLSRHFPSGFFGLTLAQFKLLELNLVLAAFLLLLPGEGIDPLGGMLAAAGSVLGYMVAILLHGQILRRLELERLPRMVRGKPLAFFSMGVVSLVFLLLGQMAGLVVPVQPVLP